MWQGELGWPPSGMSRTRRPVQSLHPVWGLSLDLTPGGCSAFGEEKPLKSITMWPGVRLGGCWVLLLAVTSAAKVKAPPPTPATKPPHIILIVADDLGWNDVSWHNRQVVTPQLEALAQSGVLLQQSYVQPICTPTRSALLAGRYPFTIGRQHGVLRPSEPTGLDLNVTLLPQSLKAAGYSTHAVGKWHLGFCSWDYTPTRRGFDTFYGYYTGSEDYYSHKRSNLFDPSMDHCNDPDMDHCNYTPHTSGVGGHPWLDLRNNTQPDHSKEGVYSTYVFASYVEQLLSSRSSEDPMFLYLALQSVHAPLQVPLNYTRHYRHIHHHERRTYLGMVSAMDEAVGRVVAALKASGHYNNSIIVFTTDNGGPTIHGANNWPLRGHKATLWEGGTRGAAFLHSPLLPNPGTVSNQLVHVTDWYRTLVGVAGGVAPQDTDGVDQWAAITGAAPSPRTHMVYNIDNTTDFKAGVRLGDYKLLVGDPGDGHWTPPPELTQTSPHGPTNHPIESLPSSTTHSPRKPVVTSDDTAVPRHLLQPDVGMSNDIYGYLISTKDNRLKNDNDANVEMGHTTTMERTTLPSTAEKTQSLQLPKKRNKATAYNQNLIFTKRHRGRLIFSFQAPDSGSTDVKAAPSGLGNRYENSIRRFQVSASTRAASLTGGDHSNTTDLDTASPSNVDIANTTDLILSTTDVNTAKTSVSTLGTMDVSTTSNSSVNLSGTFDVDPASILRDPAAGRGQEDAEREAAVDAGLEAARHLLQLLTKKSDSQIRLYNLKEDPEERVNLAGTRMDVVVEGLQFLLQQVPRYVPADIQPEVPDAADPARWHGVWSPGWC